MLFEVLHLSDADSEVLDDLSVALEYLYGVPADGPERDLALYRLLDMGDCMLDSPRKDVGNLGHLLRPLMHDDSLRRLDRSLRRLDAAFVL